MNEHVDPKRLYEMAQLHDIFNEPEWEHVRSCQFCIDKFTDCVRHEYRNNNKERAVTDSGV